MHSLSHSLLSMQACVWIQIIFIHYFKIKVSLRKVHQRCSGITAKMTNAMTLNGIDHPKVKMYVILYLLLYDFHFSAEQERRYFEGCW